MGAGQWESASFRPSYSALSSLQFAAWEHDFGLFLFAGDDATTSRNATKPSPRDNVIFETGLFLGTLGPDRTFAVRIQGSRKNQRIKIPSDLDGINFPTINRSATHTTVASVKAVAARLRERISQLSFCHSRLNLRYFYCFDRKTSEFRMVIKGVSLLPWKEILAKREFVLVSLLEDDYEEFQKDTRIAIGKARAVSNFGDDLGLRVRTNKAFRVRKGDIVVGCLVLIPKKSAGVRFATIGDMFGQGGQLVARVGYEE